MFYLVQVDTLSTVCGGDALVEKTEAHVLIGLLLLLLLLGLLLGLGGGGGSGTSGGGGGGSGGSRARADVRDEAVEVGAREGLGEEGGPDVLDLNARGLDHGRQLVGLKWREGNLAHFAATRRHRIYSDLKTLVVEDEGGVDDGELANVRHCSRSAKGAK